MVRKGGKQREKGTLIRGPDGALYFVSDRDLKAFRLPKDGVDPTQAELDELAVAEKRGALHVVSGRRGVGTEIEVARPFKPPRRQRSSPK